MKPLQSIKSKALEARLGRLKGTKNVVLASDVVNVLRALVESDFERLGGFQNATGEMGLNYVLTGLLTEYAIRLGNREFSTPKDIKDAAKIGGELYQDHIRLKSDGNGIFTEVADDESKPEVVRNYLNG